MHLYSSTNIWCLVGTSMQLRLFLYLNDFCSQVYHSLLWPVGSWLMILLRQIHQMVSRAYVDSISTNLNFAHMLVTHTTKSQSKIGGGTPWVLTSLLQTDDLDNPGISAEKFASLFYQCQCSLVMTACAFQFHTCQSLKVIDQTN